MKQCKSEARRTRQKEKGINRQKFKLSVIINIRILMRLPRTLMPHCSSEGEGQFETGHCDLKFLRIWVKIWLVIAKKYTPNMILK